MTDEQKIQIRNLRENKVGYVRISRMLGLSENTVRSYCRRNELTRETAVGALAAVEIHQHFCKCCGVPVEQNPKRKEKKFCSDKCRLKWWNGHPELIRRKPDREMTCAYCKKPFTTRESSRKYCCHDCYVSDRFGGV